MVFGLICQHHLSLTSYDQICYLFILNKNLNMEQMLASTAKNGNNKQRITNFEMQILSDHLSGLYKNSTSFIIII